MEEFHTTKAFVRDEPRVEFVETMLKSVLSVVELEYEGKPVRVDGFRLRDPGQWRSAQETSLEKNLGSFSTVCNCKCAFCYEDGNPEGLFEKQPRFVSMAEARTRLQHLHDGRGLMRESKGFFEPFINPDFLDLLALIRESDPEYVIDITTNGTLLTPEVVSRLAELKPLYVNVSLNSADEATRRSVMNDPRAATAIRAVELLRANDIPFMGSIVPWPKQGLEDMVRAVKYLDSCDAYIIRIGLPGLTRYHPRREDGVMDAWWPQVVERALELRTQLRTPIIVSPHAYVDISMEPIVQGVTVRSPAASAGVRLGDRIERVDGKRVVSRAHATSLLKRAEDQGKVALQISRGGSTIEVYLEETDRDADAYPYKPRGYRSLRHQSLAFGMCLPGSFHLQYIKQIHAAICDRGARHTLLVVSPFTVELVGTLVADLPLPEGSEVELVVPENGFFGGTVDIGDLWVLEDIARAVRPCLGGAERPDLLVIPDSFLSRWGRDLRGSCYREIESTLGIEVALVHCERIMI